MQALPELLRALVVDDEKVIADNLAMICVSKGHAARAAYSAEEAITMAQTLHHLPKPIARRTYWRF